MGSLRTLLPNKYAVAQAVWEQHLTHDGNRRCSTSLATDTEAFALKSRLPVCALAVRGVRSAVRSVHGVGARTATVGTHVSGNETVGHRVGGIHGG